MTLEEYRKLCPLLDSIEYCFDREGECDRPKLIEFIRRVAREERERCAKVICVDCRTGIAIVGDQHVETFNGRKWNCRAAAIRSLGDE